MNDHHHSFLTRRMVGAIPATSDFGPNWPR